jgi:hypothetical protein
MVERPVRQETCVTDKLLKIKQIIDNIPNLQRTNPSNFVTV